MAVHCHFLIMASDVFYKYKKTSFFHTTAAQSSRFCSPIKYIIMHKKNYKWFSFWNSNNNNTTSYRYYYITIIRQLIMRTESSISGAGKVIISLYSTLKRNWIFLSVFSVEKQLLSVSFRTDYCFPFRIKSVRCCFQIYTFLSKHYFKMYWKYFLHNKLCLSLCSN